MSDYNYQINHKIGECIYENKRNGIYDARTLGLPKMLILGLQHMFAMFGATFLVPVLVNTYFHGEGLSIQSHLSDAGSERCSST